MKRIVYRIQWHAKRGVWTIKRRGVEQMHTDWQRQAVSVAVLWARRDWLDREPAQVVLHGKDGRIRWERTYGSDPRCSKG